MREEKVMLGYFNNTNVFLMSFLELVLSFHTNAPTLSFRLMNRIRRGNVAKTQYTESELFQFYLPLIVDVCFM